MRKIINPWQGANIFHCFGCDSTHPFGLKMDFFEDGEQIVCFWKAKPQYQGYIETLHGGIHSTLHDELASWVVYVKGKTAGMTSKIDIGFYNAVLTDGNEIKLVGTIMEINNKHITVHTQLFNQQGELSSEAHIIYRIFPQELAIKKLYYPGSDAFFEQNGSI